MTSQSKPDVKKFVGFGCYGVTYELLMGGDHKNIKEPSGGSGKF